MTIPVPHALSRTLELDVKGFRSAMEEMACCASSRVAPPVVTSYRSAVLLKCSTAVSLGADDIVAEVKQDFKTAPSEYCHKFANLYSQWTIITTFRLVASQ